MILSFCRVPGEEAVVTGSLGTLGYWLLFYLGWEEGGLEILKGSRITSRALGQTQNGQAESEFWTLRNWKGLWGPAVFWLKVENHHQK